MLLNPTNWGLRPPFILTDNPLKSLPTFVECPIPTLKRHKDCRRLRLNGPRYLQNLLRSRRRAGEEVYVGEILG